MICNTKTVIPVNVLISSIKWLYLSNFLSILYLIFFIPRKAHTDQVWANIKFNVGSMEMFSAALDPILLSSTTKSPYCPSNHWSSSSVYELPSCGEPLSVVVRVNKGIELVIFYTIFGPDSLFVIFTTKSPYLHDSGHLNRHFLVNWVRANTFLHVLESGFNATLAPMLFVVFI